MVIPTRRRRVHRLGHRPGIAARDVPENGFGKRGSVSTRARRLAPAQPAARPSCACACAMASHMASRGTPS